MKKYFVYELKKNRWQLIIISAIFVLLCIAVAGVAPTRSLAGSNPTTGEKNYVAGSPCLFLLTSLVSMVCFIVPVLTYSFKMNKRSVDCYYALPLKREKLYFVKTIIGLILVIVPFTLGYWCGVLTFLCKPNYMFKTVWFVPAYFGFLFFIVCQFGINAFAYTRGNSVWDGVVFMGAYAYAPILVMLVPFVLSHGEFPSSDFLLSCMSEMDLSAFVSYMEALIRAVPAGADDNIIIEIIGVFGSAANLSVWTFVMPLLFGGAGYALLFATLRRDKAEDSQQVCESWFGYKMLIPVFSIVAIGL